MITKVLVYSRLAIEAIEPHNRPHIIVSIQTPGDPEPVKLPTNEKTLCVVSQVFHDLDRVIPGEEHDEPQMFQHWQAQQILGAVLQHPDAELFVVHCDAGLSRSPGVAAAISKILLGSDREFFRQYHPNMLVYRRILDAYHGCEDGNNHH